jgi:hypothetical protein
MHEPIYHLGLRFYLFELKGSLKYTLTRPGKAPKIHEICESDLDEASSNENSTVEEPDKLKPGLDASAVGIQLRLIKNDGSLKIEFEGRDGAVADWAFEGLALIDGRRMVAGAATQTDVDLQKCVVCKEEKGEVVQVKSGETQTDTAATQSVGVQTATQAKSSAGVQVTPQEIPLHRQVPGAVEILGRFIDSPAAKKLLERGLRDLRTRMRRSKKIFDRSLRARKYYYILEGELQNESPNTASETKAGGPISAVKTGEPIMPNKAISSTYTNVGTQTEPSNDAQVSPNHEVRTKGTTTTTTNSDLKRKASATPIPTGPLHKRAKSTHDAQPWPRHIYMECFRNAPIFKGDVGVLHIDVEAGTVWFEGWYGKEHTRVHERKQIDLRDRTSELPNPPNNGSELTFPSARISFEAFKDCSPFNRNHGVDNATHYLTIDRLNGKGDTTTLLHADCSAPDWQMWGMDAPYYTLGKPAAKDMTPITSTKVVIDALVHCIDIASGREAVHDPDTEHQLAQEVTEYKALQKLGRLGDRATTDWEWTVRELTRRERVRKQLRVVDENEELDVSVMREIKELLGVHALTNLPG